MDVVTGGQTECECGAGLEHPASHREHLRVDSASQSCDDESAGNAAEDSR